MYNPYFSQKSLEFIFYDYQRQNVLITLFLVAITFGVYGIFWIYKHNHMFQKIDEGAPESNKLVITLFLLPFVIFTGFELVFFIMGENLITEILEIVVWGILTYYTLKFIYLFCSSFGRVTLTPGIFWYFVLYTGYCSFLLVFFGFNQALFLAIIFLLGVAAMQEMVNVVCHEVDKTRKRQSFNSIARNDSIL